METLKIEDILDPIKKREMKEKYEKEFKFDPKKLKELKKIAQGSKGENPDDVENARYILFVVGESYTLKGEEGKNFWERTADRIGAYGERKIPFMQEKILAGARAEEQGRYADLLKRSKEEGKPTNLEELEAFIKRKKVDDYLAILEHKYKNNPNKLKKLEEDTAKLNKEKDVDNFIKNYQAELTKVFGLDDYVEILKRGYTGERKEASKEGDREKIKEIEKKKKELEKDLVTLNEEKINLNDFTKKYQSEISEFYKFTRPETEQYFKSIELYDADLEKIEKAKTNPDYTKRVKKIEKTSLGLLKKYNPGLYKTARHVNELNQAKKLARIPSLERALLEVGRPDLVYGPEKLVEYIKRMGREGLPVSKLSAEVWQCSKAIDALSEGQLYELATEGNPTALEYLRKNVAKNPWLLVGNKNIGGKYGPRRGTGVSKFVLKSALGIDLKAFESFLNGAREIMPHAKNEDDEKERKDKTFEGWTKELLSKETGEDVLGWDDDAFRPEKNGKINPTFDLFTRYAHPGQLGLIPPNGTLAEKRKPIITDLLRKYKNNYADEVTKKYIEKLEQTLSGQETKAEKAANAEERIEKLREKLAAADKEINRLRNLNRKEKKDMARIKKRIATDIALVLSSFDELSRTLPQEIKDSDSYRALEGLGRLYINIPELEIEKIESVRPGEVLIQPGYTYKGEIIVTPKVKTE